LPEKTFSRQVPAITASAGGSLAAFVAGNYLGVFGTIGGLFLGSIISGTAGFFLERFQRRAAELTRMKAAAIRRKGGAHLSRTETQHIQAVVDQHVFGAKKDRWIKAAKVIGVSVGIAVCFGVVFVLVATFTGKAISGTTPQLARVKDPAPTVTKTIVDTPTPTVTITPTPSYVPTTIMPTSPTPEPAVTTPTPTPTITSSTPTPSSTPS
jgi:hypothetical protein